MKDQDMTRDVKALTEQEIDEWRIVLGNPLVRDHSEFRTSYLSARRLLATIDSLSLSQGGKDLGGDARQPASSAWHPIASYPRDHFVRPVWDEEHGQHFAFLDVAWTWWLRGGSEPLGWTPTHWHERLPHPLAQSKPSAAPTHLAAPPSPEAEASIPTEQTGCHYAGQPNCGWNVFTNTKLGKCLLECRPSPTEQKAETEAGVDEIEELARSICRADFRSPEMGVEEFVDQYWSAYVDHAKAVVALGYHKHPLTTTAGKEK